MSSWSCFWVRFLIGRSIRELGIIGGELAEPGLSRAGRWAMIAFPSERHPVAEDFRGQSPTRTVIRCGDGGPTGHQCTISSCCCGGRTRGQTRQRTLTLRFSVNRSD